MTRTYRSTTLGTVVSADRVTHLSHQRVAALEAELTQRIQRIKAATAQAGDRGDRLRVHALQLEHADLTVWHQRLLARRQQLREQRHRVFSESFVQVAKERLDPELLKRLIAATQKRLAAEASTPIRQPLEPTARKRS